MDNSTLKKRVARRVAAVRRKYRINSRLFTRKDFYRICRGERINLISPQNIPGSKEIALTGFYISGTIKMLYLRCFYKGPFDLQVAYHELGHHFCKHTATPISGFDFDAYNNSPNEIEADLFAELCTGEVRR